MSIPAKQYDFLDAGQSNSTQYGGGALHHGSTTNKQQKVTVAGAKMMKTSGVGAPFRTVNDAAGSTVMTETFTSGMAAAKTKNTVSIGGGQNNPQYQMTGFSAVSQEANSDVEDRMKPIQVKVLTTKG